MAQFENKVVIVTGGATGIGRATAVAFAREAAAVTIADINEEAGQSAANAIQASGGQALFVKADVALASGAQEAVARTVAAFGGVDVLFNKGLPTRPIGWFFPQRRPPRQQQGLVHDR
jgi:NAD(P)-dependent dehydrogenase (short-subunit alcohol dehydrogenase family)